MKKSAKIFILLIPVIISTVVAQSDTDWFPLAEGNWWLYESEGFVLDDSDTISMSGTIYTVIKEELMHDNGFLVYAFQTIMNIDMLPDTSDVFLRHADGELRSYHSLSSDQYDVWITYTETNLEPEIIVPAGNFSNCTVITLPFVYGITIEHFLHRGTGIVKTEFSGVFYNTTESLSDFNLN